MAIYTIRPEFVIDLDGTIFIGGEEVELTDAQFQLHKHKLEGIEDPPIPDQPGGNNGGGGGDTECCYPAPYLTAVVPDRILVGMDATLKLEGSFFTTELEITATGVTVNNVNFLSDNLVEVAVTAGSDLGFFDFTLDNGKSAEFTQVLEVAQPLIVDLRGGSGVVVEKGTRTNLSYQDSWLQVNCTGSNWQGSVRFVGANDEYVWNRNEKKSLSWLFFPTTYMIGFGSRGTDLNNTAQYTQGETLGYFNNVNTFWGLYGNNGDIGRTATQYFNLGIPNNGNPFKLTLSDNGEPGGTYALYELPVDDTGWQSSGLTRQEFVAQNLNPGDWFSTEGLVTTGIIASSMSADEPEIMPFLAMPTNQTARLIGFYIE